MTTNLFIGMIVTLTDYATGQPLFEGVGVIQHIECGAADGVMVTIAVRDENDERGWRELPQIPARQIK